jgi:hypothetical protein
LRIDDRLPASGVLPDERRDGGFHFGADGEQSLTRRLRECDGDRGDDERER